MRCAFTGGRPGFSSTPAVFEAVAVAAMKILHVITTINRGGAENHLLDLTTGQAAEGHTVAVCYLKGDGYWCQALVERGIRVELLDLGRYGDPRPAFRLRSLLDEIGPDIVHAHMPPAELYARLALLGRKRPALVISKHNDEPFYRGPGQFAMRSWVAARASTIIAISDAVKGYTQREITSYRGAVRTVHYGIDVGPYESVRPADVAALRAGWGIPDDAWAIGTVARLVPQKSLHVLIAAYAAYLRRASKPSRLVIVGRGPLENELKQQASTLGIADSVIWAGFRSDIPVVMNAFDAFALTSKYEGFGLVLLEAMAARKPVLATGVSAIPEIVRDGETGLLCEPENVEEIARALKQLELQDQRTRLGDAGGARARAVFTIGRMLARTNETYEAVLQ